tara:strand:- start:1142 stop:1801 length:660 start_codon:yes stop_codon:yes gene_type:complete
MSSDLKVTNIKHQSSSSNNLVLASDGSATATLSSTSVVPASVGSSFVLVKSSQAFAVDTGDTTSSAYIENLFNSTYRDYVVYITGTVGTTQGDPQFRFGNSSGRNSNSNYSFVIQTEDSGSTPRTFVGSDTDAAALLNGAKGNTGTFNRITITMTIHNPQASGGIFWSGTSSNPRSGTAYLVNYFGGTLNEDYQATNMQFFFNFGSGTWNIQSYGIKSS